MSRMSMFNSPFLLGFDEIERVLDQVSKTKSQGYPPYNIERISHVHLRITIAVAGFSLSDLEISTQDNQLLIRGKQNDQDDQKNYLYRGIASRQFQKVFVLADGIEVAGAFMEQGLLHIDLNRVLPEPVVKNIQIQERSCTEQWAYIDSLDKKTPSN